jgi:hypothetical protein
MRRLLYPAAASLLLGLAACKGLSSIQAAAPPASTAAPAVPLTAGAGALRVLAEPGAGLSEIYRLITGARSSVDLTMYELRDQTAERDLAADAARHVTTASLDYNRELGIRTANPAVIKAIGAVIASDYAGARAYPS